MWCGVCSFFFQAEDGIRDLVRSRGLGDVYKRQGQMGQNYLKSLFALAFQGFLIMVCVAIYAVLVQSIPAADSIHGAIWGTAGYTVLLCFTLFKTGSLSKALFGAH